MTEKKLHYALERIAECKKDKHYLEAQLRCYHLNVSLIGYILSNVLKEYSPQGKKLKELLKDCNKAALTHPELKRLVARSSVKSCKTWAVKTETFFKHLKISSPEELPEMLEETEKICAILKLSATKLFTKRLKLAAY